MQSLIVMLGILLLVVTGLAQAEDVIVLGQSQTEKVAPLRWQGVAGVESGDGQDLWIAAGSHMERFAVEDEEPRRIDAIEFPGRILSTRQVDRMLVCHIQGRGLWTIPCAGGIPVPLAPGFEPVGPWTIISQNLHQGWGGHPSRVLALDGVRVLGIDSSTGGCSVLGVIGDPPASATARAMLVDPFSGDLLVAYGYPADLVARLRSDGTQVISDGWPAQHIRATCLGAIDGALWAVGRGEVIRLPATTADVTVVVAGQEAWFDTVGLARQGGRWWLASHQGVIVLDGAWRSCDRRVGGLDLDDASSLAISPTGTVLVSRAKGTQWVRLRVQGWPWDPLGSACREAWCTGGSSWRVCATGIAWESDGFLVLDRTGGRLWRFNPDHTLWGDRSWRPVTSECRFKDPRAIAASDLRWWVADGQRMISGPIPAIEGEGDQLTMLEGIGQPICALAAIAEDTVMVAAGSEVVAFRQHGSELVVCWRRNLDQPATALAAGTGWIAVCFTGVVMIIDPMTGRELARKCLPGGPVTACVGFRSWLACVVPSRSAVLLYRMPSVIQP